jgi:hypothetical protein
MRPSSSHPTQVSGFVSAAALMPEAMAAIAVTAKGISRFVCNVIIEFMVMDVD